MVRNLHIDLCGPEAGTAEQGLDHPDVDAFLDQQCCGGVPESDLSPRELVVRFTDTEKYFVSEASVYRVLKSCDLITSPAYVVVSAADEFRDKTTRPNQVWQTDFTYLKVIG